MHNHSQGFKGYFGTKRTNTVTPREPGWWGFCVLFTFLFFLTFYFQPHSWSWLRSRLISQRLGFWEQNLVKLFSYSFAFSCYSLCFPLLESLYPVRPLNVVLHVADMITVWKFTYEITRQTCQTMHFLAIDSRKHCSVAFQKWNFKHRLDVVYRDHV